MTFESTFVIWNVLLGKYILISILSQILSLNQYRSVKFLWLLSVLKNLVWAFYCAYSCGTFRNYSLRKILTFNEIFRFVDINDCSFIFVFLLEKSYMQGSTKMSLKIRNIKILNHITWTDLTNLTGVVLWISKSIHIYQPLCVIIRMANQWSWASPPETDYS